MPRQFGAGRSFVSGELEGDRIRIHYFWKSDEKVLMAKVWFGLGAEGPVEHAHGGSSAAVLDECMGFAAWVSGYPVVAANLSVNFLRKAPLHVVHHVEARVEGVEDQKVTTRGRLFDPATGRVYVEAHGLFIVQPLEKFGDLVMTRAMMGRGKD